MVRYRLLCLTLIACCLSSVASGQFTPKSLPLIPPGTTFTDGPPQDWSHLILFVRGNLASGDLEEVTDTVRYYAEVFNLVMLADAKPASDGKFQLGRVGVGFSMRINDQNVVVNSATQKELGGDLSFIGRGVLSGNYDALADIKQVARTAQTMVIDAPTMMLRDGKHQKMMVRYFVWVYPSNGKVGTAAWLLDSTESGGARSIVDPTMQVLPPSFQEDRVMNVKSEHFNFLGIPSPEAFALVKIPQGKPYKMNDAMRAVAGKAIFDERSYAALVSGFTKSLSTTE